MFYKAIGYVKQKGKDNWDKFRDDAIFYCPDNQNPYEFLTKDYINHFDYWLVIFEPTNKTV